MPPRFRDPRWALILLFLGILAGVPLIQLVIEARQGGPVRVLGILRQPPTAANLRAFERDLEDANWAAQASRPWLQFAQFAWLRYGGEKAVIGRDGWYFFKPGLDAMLTRSGSSASDSITGQAAAIAAVRDFGEQLAARGIRLLVLPVPNKESIYPDRLVSRVAAGRGVLAPRTREFLEALRTAGIETVDLFQVFGDARGPREAPERPFYLAQDTHWSPAGAERAAEATARRLVDLGWVRPGEVAYGVRELTIQKLGDIPQMLRSAAIEDWVQPELVSCRQVIDPRTGEAYQETADAEILVLGDSFLRVYGRDEPGGAGFTAHLARELRRPVMALVNDGGGATLVRKELQARPGFLHSRKVVVWEFVERDLGLAVGGWDRVALPPILAP